MEMYKLSRDKEAIPHLKEAVRLKPAYPEAQYNLGLLLLLAGQRSAALDQYQTLKNQHSSLAAKLFAVLYRDQVLSIK
jgi:tetratricopeptide (TPR) repeat protein